MRPPWCPERGSREADEPLERLLKDSRIGVTALTIAVMGAVASSGILIFAPKPLTPDDWIGIGAGCFLFAVFFNFALIVSIGGMLLRRIDRRESET
ncbi:MAG: hypothetical protein AAF995_02645 [Planctomycetota bacterium]